MKPVPGASGYRCIANNSIFLWSLEVGEAFTAMSRESQCTHQLLKPVYILTAPAFVADFLDLDLLHPPSSRQKAYIMTLF